jgi:hypothetical protein
MPLEAAARRAARHTTETNCIGRQVTAEGLRRSNLRGTTICFQIVPTKEEHARQCCSGSELPSLAMKISLRPGRRCRTHDRLVDTEAPAISEAEGSAP